MELSQVLMALRAANEPVPQPLRLPAAAEVSAAEHALGVVFPSDYRRFLLEASDVAVGTYEPFVLTATGSHLDLVPAVRKAWRAGVPEDLIPFCEDNGNYFCLTSAGLVVYFDHNGLSGEQWSDFAEWVAVVWLGGE